MPRKQEDIVLRIPTHSTRVFHRSYGPTDLLLQQQPLHDNMNARIGAKYDLTVTMRRAMLPWSMEPLIAPAGDKDGVLGCDPDHDGLRQDSRRCQEITILAVGAHFGAAYDIYAHAAVAEAVTT